MSSRALRLAEEAQAMFAAADAENRALTSDERVYVKDLLDRAKDHHEHEKAITDLGRRLGAPSLIADHGGAMAGAGLSPGEMFVRSDGYKSVTGGNARGQSWTTGLVDVGLQAKGTLLEGTGSPGSGTGGGWLATPQVVPGIVPKLFQPLTLEALLSSGQATGNTVRYAVEGTASSGAAGVAEGGLKPQSTLAFSTLDEPIKKIATTVKVSDEMLEDAVAVQAFVTGQLSLFCRIEAERQLFRGTQGGNEVHGILTSRGCRPGFRAEPNGDVSWWWSAVSPTREQFLREPESRPELANRTALVRKVLDSATHGNAALRITVGKAKDKKSPRGRGRPKFAESEERFQIDELDTVELLDLPPRVEALTLALYWASIPETRSGKRMEPLRVPAHARYSALDELGLERPGDELKLALEPMSRYARAVLAHLPREWDATGEDAAFHARLTSEQRLIRNRRRGLGNAAL